MKFSIAATAIAATSSFVGVHVHASSTSTSKSGKGSCSSSPKLEKFCYEEPVDFEGTYDLCYSNVLREAKTGPTGTFHFCPNGNDDVHGEVFKKLDEYGAYEASVYEAITTDTLGVNVAQWKFQGIAQGDSIKLTTFGGGAVNGNGDVILPNESPDTKECTVYDEGILKCVSHFQEYCGPNTANETFFPSDCEVGEWLLSTRLKLYPCLKDSSALKHLRGFVLMDLLVASSRKRRRKPVTLALC